MISVNWIKSDAWNVLGICAPLNSIFGLWPLDEDNFFRKMRCFVPIAQLILLFAGAIYELYVSCNNVEYSVDTLLGMTFGVLALAKLILYYINRDKLRINVESAIEDWLSLNLSDSHSIMHTWKKISSRIVKIYILIGTLAASSYLLKVYFIDRDSFIKFNENDDLYARNTTAVVKKKFLFPLVCSLNHVSQKFYHLITINQCYQYFICTGVNLTTDLFFVTIIYHLCGQFEILKKQFARFAIFNNEQQTRREFCNLLARHQHLLELAISLEDSFSMIVFTQMTLNIILINVSGFNALIFLKRNEKYSVIANSGIMIFLLVQTFMYSHIGEIINNQIEEIGQSVYEGPWQTVPKTMSKNIILIMMRSNVSFYLTAGKLFKITHSTFTTVVKTAFSYLSVLNLLIKN